MKHEFLHKEGNGRLILIFAGWSTDASFYAHIHVPGWDTLVVWGYSDLDFPHEIIGRYSTVALFAWSMGVYVASRVIDFSRIALAVAVNGTEIPVNNDYGIPEVIFDGTASTLNERNLMKFRKRMGTPSVSCSKDNIDQLREELRFIRYDSATHHGNARWQRVYISENDRIFTPSSQNAAWKIHPSHPEIVTLSAPHYVDLNNIIKAALPSKQKVGDRFQKALSTYDSQARAQRIIAHHLVDMAPDTVSLDKIIEIGPGTGIFSRLLAEKFSPNEIEYIDLYPINKMDLAEREIYYVADAEEWLSDMAKKRKQSADGVMSASALQWFVNPDNFFRNVAEILRPEGVLLCSTFLPGNLHELGNINPYGLIYRNRDELEEMVKRRFGSYKISEEEITLSFDSPREALLHLSHTGVAGESKSSIPVKELLQNGPRTLTYRAIYIFAKILP